MSLRIWLPLTKDLRNLGSANASVINTSAVINANGKLGKCYSFGTGKSYLKFNDVNFMHSMTECSVSLWLKILTWNTSYATYFQFGLGSTPWAHYIFGLLRNNANSTLCFTISDGTNATNANCLTPTITLNEWYHLTFTYSNGHCKIYVNGAETKDYTTTIVPNFTGITTGIIGACNNGNNYLTNCLMNDFRVYDHCLSPEEVREIANGLVLHYKLDLLMTPNLLSTDPTLTITETSDTDKNLYSSNIFLDPIIKELGCLLAGTPVIVEYDYTVNQLSEDTQSKVTLYTLFNGSRMAPAVTLTEMRTLSSGHVKELFKITQSLADYTNAFRIRWRFQQGITGDSITISNARFYIGTEEEKVVDSSGYGHDTTIESSAIIVSDGGKYDRALLCDSTHYLTITNNMIIENNAPYAISCWFKSNDRDTSLQILINGSTYTIDDQSIKIAGKTADGRRLASTSMWSGSYHTCNNQWHLCYSSFQDATLEAALDNKIHPAVLNNEENPLVSNLTNIQIGKNFNGQISDVRIYATPLLDSEIKKLYNINMGMDNKNQIHTYEFNELAATPLLHKTGVLDGLINEFPYCPYDPLIYVEPDGSAWIRIYHHNNPAAAVFASSDSFTTSVYKDEDRWFYVSLCNLVDKWELMVKTKYTPASTELKRRWVLTVNPMTATFALVAAANITENTTTGYSHISWGGLYHIGSNTYLCTNSGTNGNWWGAVGAWSLYLGGIPGWLGIVTKTGYNDLYLRVDNVNFTNTMLHNDINWLANGAIER